MVHRTRPLDDHVVWDAIDGDDDALAQVVEAWMPRVYAWCARLGAGRIDAEEAAHDVFVAFMRRRGSLEGPERLGSWLFGACRRTVANHRKRVWWKRWVQAANFDAWPGLDATDEPVHAAEEARRIATALDALSSDHREVLVLCYLEDRSVAEAAELIGVPAGTVKSRLFHARANFERAYGPDGRPQ